MSIHIDNLEARVISTEKRLNEAFLRISTLEDKFQVSQQPTLLSNTSPPVHLKDTDESYILCESDDDDDDPVLPPPVQPPPPTVPHYTDYSYMPAAPLYLHQTGQPPYFQHLSEQSAGYSHSHTSPLHPVQLSKYYNSPPNTLVSPPMSSTIPPTVPSSVPKCLRIQGKRKTSILPSIEINKENLSPCDIILKRYSTLHNEKAIGTLAVKLASESFFGNDVLKKCTVMGLRGYPALPTKELNELKQTIFSIFPKYWSNVAEFEVKIWNLCSNSIGQLCKRLRAE